MANTIQETKSLKAGLYIVATPIGNMGDITSRAVDTLRNVDVIACEDTRVTGKLLMALGFHKPMIPYHEHNGDRQRPRILEKIMAGERVALVSDAGTPLISDPGFKLVAEAQDSNLEVISLPGACAAITALTLTGLPTDRFTFLGFSPHKSASRKTWFAEAAELRGTLIYYESTRRLPESLADAAPIFANRQAAMCRELTKKFEEVRRGTCAELAEHYAEHGAPKGEAVMVIGPAPKAEKTNKIEIDAEKALKIALNHLKVKDAANLVSELTGEKKKDLYNKALEIKDNE